MKTCLILLFSASSLLLSCRKEKAPQERSFYMGVTPWPADFTFEEVDSAYRFIDASCDLVSQHFDDGIPWEEAFTGAAWPSGFEQDIQYRKSRSSKAVFLSVAALDITRKQKAAYNRTSTQSQLIKDSWASLAFDDPKVVTAYVNYMKRLINLYQPVYVNYGVESNLLTWDPAAFAHYKNFLSQVYSQLKAAYPTIPFLLSFMVDESDSGLGFAGQLLPYTDIVGLSAYPYVAISSSNGGNTDPAAFPTNYFQRYFDLAPGKKLAFAETGYLAQPLSIPAFSLTKNGTAAWQQQYLEKILNYCQQQQAVFLIWFCAKDYNAATTRLQASGNYDPIFSIWEDTGLIDEKGNRRPAYNSWMHWFSRKRVP